MTKPRVADVVVALVLAIAVAAGESVIAARWSQQGVFAQYDVIFDSDPNQELPRMAHAYGSGGFNHPLLSYVFGVPIRAAQEVAGAVGLVPRGESWREAVAVYVAPFCAMIKVVALYTTFRVLGLSLASATLASLFSALSFSSVVFGAVPTTYSASGAVLALLTCLASISLKLRHRLVDALWFAAGVLAIGITSSNVIHFGWMRFVAHFKERHWTAALVRSVVEGAIALTTVLALQTVLTQIRGDGVGMLLPSQEFLRQYSSTPAEQMMHLARFPETLGRTVVPTLPDSMSHAYSIEHGDPITVTFTYNSLPFGAWPVTLFLVGVMILGGALVGWRLGGAWRTLSVGSLGALLSVAVLYSVFGLNTYLYSQYWQVPAAVLIAACLAHPWFATTRSRAVVVALLGILLVGDVLVLRAMTRRIELDLERPRAHHCEGIEASLEA